MQNSRGRHARGACGLAARVLALAALPGQVLAQLPGPVPAPLSAPALHQAPTAITVVGTRPLAQPADDPWDPDRRGAPAVLPMSSQSIDADAWKSLGVLRVEDLAGLVPGLQVDVSNGGLSSAVKLRGFAVTRLLRDGLPDTQRMFSRDLATVERIEVLAGPNGLFHGVTSPGGVLQYITKQPLNQRASTAQFSVDHDGVARAMVDLTGPLANSGLAYRLVASAQDGSAPPADLPQRSRTLLAALGWAYQAGASVGVDVEWMDNQTPYRFGTVVTGGGSAHPQVQYDRLYVLPGGAPALRQTQRLGLRWQQQLDNGVLLSAQWSRSLVNRRETLVGFFGLLSDTALSGYATTYDDAFAQNAAALRAEGDLKLAGLDHHAAVGWQTFGQRFLFTGTQNIGGFTLNVAQPDFSRVDLAALPQRRRYNNELQQESAWWLSDRVRLASQLHLTAGLRGVAYRIDADRSGAGLQPATRQHGQAHHLGLAGQLLPQWTAHIAHSTGLEPNRGTTRDGSFLPPQRQQQWELGLRWAPSPGLGLAAAAYRIRLGNLPMTDPADRTAVISAGERQVQGLQMTGNAAWAGWALDGQANLLRTRQLVRTSATLGDSFTGVANRTAGLRVGRSGLSGPGSGWPDRLTLAAQAVGPRFADAANTTRLPGYGVAHLSADWTLRAPATGAAGSSITASAGVRNLFDRRYLEAVTALDDAYQGQRRQVWLRLTVQH